MTAPAPPRPRTEPGRRRRVVAGLVIAGALAFLGFRAAGSATVYFKTADEAVAQRSSLGTHRFRLEGTVVPGSVHDAAGEVDFTVRGDGGATVEVIHKGDVPELFQPTIPVVLEGRFQGDAFLSDRILVRHTNEYKARNPERVKDYKG
ncbi:MAG TPA: cytochrome c maturation protein CcmE [Acidimicrobiales bacterium]|nr:cytochrome c maturation protein CcmE [Acidimicrobiales bacterium]